VNVKKAVLQLLCTGIGYYIWKDRQRSDKEQKQQKINDSNGTVTVKLRNDLSSNACGVGQNFLIVNVLTDEWKGVITLNSTAETTGRRLPVQKDTFDCCTYLRFTRPQHRTLYNIQLCHINSRQTTYAVCIVRMTFDQHQCSGCN